MKNRFAVLLILIFAIFLTSCKNDVKNGEVEIVPSVTSETPVMEKPARKTPTDKDMDRANSVMARLMVTPETKKYTRNLVTAGLSELLSNDPGPFTVFAPSNSSIDSMDVERRKFYLNPKNKEQLTTLLKSHIFKGNMDSASILQAINKNGKLKLKNLAGGTLTATKNGTDIIISDEIGGKAVMQKSDITGSNGVVHVIDGILNLEKTDSK